ncbi:MAG TPA: bifunctional acetate--CoA ligase family protein/GNAT family N-acetyltransferase [Syntrophorhabdales bacterium]|nr:bifunctional acetate--CoA ligase family protein/GNAT family N-acetyltransferase [Syntrophorhabdales bacterium]
MGDIRKMFDPKNIALFGAGDGRGAFEARLITNLNIAGGRKIFLVGIRNDDLPVQNCFPDMESVPEKVDLAVVAAPAPKVPAIIESCGKAGVEGAVIVSSGFREVGETGKKLEEELKEIRKQYGIRILGPNSAGIIRPAIGLNTSRFELQPERGNIALISQSASVGGVVLDRATTAHVGFSMFVSLGSMIDIGFGDLIDFVGEDPQTRSIILYMETVGEGRKFVSAARGFARNKPIVVMKPGQSKESARASLFHTGSMAGDDAAYDVAFKRAGVVRVKEVSDLLNAAEVLHSANLPAGRRMAIITNAGGPGVIATDVLMASGGRLARLTEKSIEELSSFLPAHWSKGNPVDLFGDADIERYTRAVTVCLNDQGVDGILVIYIAKKVFDNAADPTQLAEAVAAIAKNAHKPLITTWMGSKNIEEGREILKEHNIPTYETPEEAIKTVLYMYRYKRNLELLYETPDELPVDQAPPKNHLKVFIRKTLKEGRRVLTEEESKDFLKNYGIRSTAPFLATSVESAAVWAERIGYPVVLKIVSADVVHRSEVGGMAEVYSPGKLKTEHAKILERVKANAPEISVSGITVEKMIENIDYELILGSKKDEDFGSIILFGMGGKGTALVKDFSIGLPPLNQTLARLMIEETGVYKLLRGLRGKKAADLRELEQIIVSFSNLIVDFPEIAEMEINPIAISDGTPYAVNARIVLEKNTPDSSVQYPHLVITPYPTRYVSHWLFPDGKDVVLRPIRPEDEPLEHELLTSLSDASMRTRFFTVIKDISHEMLVRFCNIDYEREIAIVAEVRENERRKMIGIGRLIIDREFKSGEFAVLVHDNYHGKGLGYKLVDVLIGIGEEKGLQNIYGEVLTGNDKMLAVCRKLGFTIESTDEDMTRVVLPL